MEGLKQVLKFLVGTPKKPKTPVKDENGVQYGRHSLKPKDTQGKIKRADGEQNYYQVGGRLDQRSITYSQRESPGSAAFKGNKAESLPEKEPGFLERAEDLSRYYCENELCQARGTKQDIEEKSIYCPYPLSVFPCQQVDGFLQNNIREIKEFLNSSPFPDLKSTIDSIKLVNKGGNARLEVCLRYAPNDKSRAFSYQATHINEGDSAWDCFKNLLLDLRTDQMMLYLESFCPAMFEKGPRGLGTYVSDYSLWSDYIELNEVHRIPLLSIFNPETKRFNWDSLANEMQNIKLSYESLFRYYIPRITQTSPGISTKKPSPSIMVRNEKPHEGVLEAPWLL